MISQRHGPPPSKAAHSVQAEWLAQNGHSITPADANFGAYLERLDSENVIHLVDRASCRDAQFLRREMGQAEADGVLFMMTPRPVLSRHRPQVPAGETDPRAAFTITRAQASDPVQYLAAKKVAQENGQAFPVVVEA